MLFPHETIRPVQEQLMNDISIALEQKKNILAHAPTGLGKTASALSVALPFALKHGLTVFFLTNRHTQHQIAIQTLRDIKKKHGTDFVTVDIIGKKWMCAQEGVRELYQQEFMEYCKAVREGETCEFYEKLYTKDSTLLSVAARRVRDEVVKKGAMHSEELKSASAIHRICPYYFASELAKQATVVVGDYSLLFNPPVHNSFFSRAGKELGKSILIIDEAHNLADRIRASSSSKLSDAVVGYAVQEAAEFGLSSLGERLRLLQRLVSGLCTKEEERVVSREEFIGAIEVFTSYEPFVDELLVAGEDIREKKKKSFLGSVGDFLELWGEEHTGFVRYAQKTFGFQGIRVTLHCGCLDIVQFSAPVFEKAYASVLMSGTLMPPSMFGDMLGVQQRVEKVYPSPFPPENRLVMVVPDTSTKFQLRNDVMYQRIASTCADIVQAVPGNSALFFPSYEIKQAVVARLAALCGSRPIFDERSMMSSEEKGKLLGAFKACKERGAVLCAVVAANFSEGVDLPGDFLKAVVIVGVPLARPDIPVKALINYYDKQFSQGWDYGYVLPAMTKCLQAAGRCIRSETDRGIIVFLDQRFTWRSYYRCLPPDWGIDVTRQHVEKIKKFFGL